MFSAGHFLFLAAGAVFVFFLCRIYKRRGTIGRRRIRLITAGAALFLELLRAGLLAAAGEYDVYRLPLHLCGMAVYISAFHALTQNRLTGQFLYAFCMPGAIFALIFPDWSYYPLFHFMTFTGFALHVLLVAYTLMLVTSGELVPQTGKLPACLAVMLVLAAGVYVFDRATGTNYMFLNWPSEGSPLEWFSSLGRPGYILGYFPILAVVWTIMYLPFTLKIKSAD